MVAATLQSKQLAQISGYSTGEQHSCPCLSHIPTINVFLAASWLVNVWEWFIRLDDEVIFIWPYVVVFFYAKPCGTRFLLHASMAHTAYIKWLYFFGKYFGLAVQT